ncbi:MAG: hypothetical protein ABI920_15115 [Casimicrobiaceae bacterium]
MTDGSALVSPSGPYRALKHFGLALLCAAWIFLGLVGHDPWKSEDATTFGVVWDMMNGGSMLTPTLAGIPHPERPPLVYALGTMSGELFQGWLKPHDAARLSVAVLLTITLAMVSFATRELAGKSIRWLPVLIFVGSIGLWDRSHQLSPEVGLLAGLSVALYGFALAPRRPVRGGIVMGVGTGLAFLAHGLQGPIWITGAALLLPILSGQWRGRRYASTAGTAILVAAVLLVAWPLALALQAPTYLAAWWRGQELGSFVAAFAPRADADPVYILKNLPWFTWPSAPLVLWTLWTRGRGFNGGLRSTGVLVPGAMALAILVGLLTMPEPRPNDLMMLIVPLVVLASIEVDTLKRGFSGALDWFGILTFALLGSLAWWAWWDAYVHGMSRPIAHLLRDTTVGYQPSFHGRAMIVCVLLTILWLMLVRPARRSNRRAILNWAAGTTLLWAMFATIWLPYLDSRRSYRLVAEAAATHLPRNGCIASRNLGDAQRALFYYFAGIHTIPEDGVPVDGCATLLVQYARGDIDAGGGPGWIVSWEGQRRGDETERYVIYTRDDDAVPQNGAASAPARRTRPGTTQQPRGERH